MSETNNTSTQVKYDEAVQKLENIREERDSLKDKVKKLTAKLDEANRFLEADQRVELMKEAKRLTSYSEDDLNGLALDELQHIVKIARMSKPRTKHKNIQISGTDVDPEYPIMTLPDMFEFGPDARRDK